MILKRKWERNQTLCNDKKKKKINEIQRKIIRGNRAKELQVRKELAKWQE